MSDDQKACRCWTSSIGNGHEGHCCFAEDTQDPQLIGPLRPLPCGHEEEGVHLYQSTVGEAAS